MLEVGRAMTNASEVDHIVIGAGLAGASAAAYLAARANVAVLECEEHAGYHSTGRYAARHDQVNLLERFCSDPDIAERVVLLSGDEVLERLPIFRRDYPAGGAVDPGSADIDVDALHQGFLRQAREVGAQLHLNCKATTLCRSENHWLVETAAGAFRAPTVVNAAGAWGDDVARRAGIAPVGVMPKRRTVVLVETPMDRSSASWPAAIDIAEQFYSSRTGD